MGYELYWVRWTNEAVKDLGPGALWDQSTEDYYCDREASLRDTEMWGLVNYGM